jgi:Arm DNA-binding domain
VARGLTTIAVANAMPKATRREIPDPGCAGLHLVVQPSGKKSWAVRYRIQGKPRKLTLGPVAGNEGPDAVSINGRALTLAAARTFPTPIRAAPSLRSMVRGTGRPIPRAATMWCSSRLPTERPAENLTLGRFEGADVGYESSKELGRKLPPCDGAVAAARANPRSQSDHPPKPEVV